MASAIRSLVNDRDVQFECVLVLHETLLVHSLTYGNTLSWREKIRAVQMANFKGSFGIRSMGKGVVPSEDERIDCLMLRG